MREPMLAHESLMDHAADVARYFIAFEAYRGSRAGALRALRRRAAGFSPREYESALDQLEREYPGFPTSTYTWVAEWVHLYYHLM